MPGSLPLLLLVGAHSSAYVVKDDGGVAPLPTCAVVFSSGVMLKDTYGADVDEHDQVFRFNMLSTAGFETHVGAKTTHQVRDSRGATDIRHS
jgi:hypothetical protein